MGGKSGIDIRHGLILEISPGETVEKIAEEGRNIRNCSQSGVLKGWLQSITI